jgi:myosin heavy subunit
MAAEDALKLLAAILAATVLAVNLSIVRPMKDRMEELKREVTTMQSEMQLLVGERDQVRSTNDLLSGLKAQEAAFEDARHSLAALRQFREEIAAECQKTTEAMASVEKLDTLQRTVLHYRDLTEPATKVLGAITGLEKQLIDQNVTTDDAVDAVNRLTALKRNLMSEAVDTNAAEAGLGQMANLKTQVLSQTEDLSTAAARAKQLVDLKSQIVEKTGDLDAATTAVRGLLAVKDQLVVHGGHISEAQQSAERLLGLRDRLAENSVKTDAAEHGAARMIEIQKKLAGEIPNLAESIKSVETLIDFQHEFQKQIRSLDGMRRSLMDFVLMENTVTRALHILQPLLELGNLRHLNEDQLRDIARSISENQSTRISKNDSGHGLSRLEPALGPSQYNRDEPVDGPRGEDSVPWPIEPE